MKALKSMHNLEKKPISIDKIFSHKKLSEPLKHRDVKKLIKYFDVSSPNLQLRNKTIERRQDSILSSNTKIFHTKIILDEENQEKIKNEENNIIETHNDNRSRENSIKSGSPILWLKNQKNIKKSNDDDDVINRPIRQKRLSSFSPLTTTKACSTQEKSVHKVEQLITYDYKTLIKGIKNEMSESISKKQNSKKYSILEKQGSEGAIEEAISSIELSDSLKNKYPQSISNEGEQSNSSNVNEKAGAENQKKENDETLFKTLKTINELDPITKTQGKKIRFKMGEIIAEGSSSLVYKALNLDDGSIFVVKKYNSINDQTGLDTFWNEVNIYKQLNHQNVIKFYDSEIIENVLYVYLEYLPGGSLKSLIDRYGALEEKIIKIYLKQILNGVSYIHSKGIVHRDIKSANILLDLNGRIKISDFGVSGQITISNLHEESQAFQSMKGTLPFMAPEVILQQKYGNKADIWSIGCTVLEMATATIPWGNFDNKFQAIFKIGRSNDIPFIPDTISPLLKDFLLCCFKRSCKERENINVLLKHPFLS